jgi:hypothetical protein
MICAGCDAVLVEPVCNLIGIARGQGVDDPGSGQRVDVFQEPGKTRRLGGQTQSLKRQRLTHQGSALDHDVAELGLDI